MTNRRIISTLIVAAFGLCTSAWAQSNADLQKKIDQLQDQVKQLQTQQLNAKDVDATVNAVLSDAKTRSQLLAEGGGVTAGFLDDRFQIRSASGDFTLIPGIQFQFRSVTTYADNAKANGDANIDNGFEVRRLKFSLEGTAFTKNLYYNFVWATDRHTGELINEEAYVRYQFADNFALQGGQFKQITFQQTGVSSKRFMAVERDIVSEVLLSGDAYSQGVVLLFDNKDNLQASLGFTDGYNSRNTNFQDPPTNMYDFGVMARVNFKLFGDWKSYSDFTAMKNTKDLLVIGAGVDWSQNGDIDEIRHAVDVQWEMGQLGLFLAYTGAYIRNPAADDVYHWGVLAQVAYMIDPQVEVFARFAYLKMDDSAGFGDEDTFYESTLGLNYYLKGHAAKFTIDVGWLCNGLFTDADSAGILSNQGENEFYIRGQFQLLL